MSATHPSGCCRIAPQSGVAFRLRASEVLRIYDPFGEQVADLFAFAENDHACSLSSGRTIDYASKIYLTKGDVLYANDSRPMFRILEDAVGRHDFLLTPCSQEMFEILYKHRGHHPSCFENLYRAFELRDPARADRHDLQRVHERRRGRERGSQGSAALVPGRRLYRAARTDEPHLRLDCLLCGELQQRLVQADRLRDPGASLQ